MYKFVSIFLVVALMSVLSFMWYWYYTGLPYNYLAGLESVNRIQIYKNDNQVAGADIHLHTFSKERDPLIVNEIIEFFTNNVSQLVQNNRNIRLYKAVFDDLSATGEDSITIYFNPNMYEYDGHGASMDARIFEILTTKNEP